MSFLIQYQFSAVPWQYKGKGAWIFVTVPEDLSSEIRSNLKWQEEGWGRLKAKVKIGRTEWDTAIWFDSKINCYLLPLKAIIRKKESIDLEKTITIKLFI